MSIILLPLLFIFAYTVYAFKDYPMTIVVTSTKANENNSFFLNGQRVGDEKGFCTRIRDQKVTVFTLKNSTKSQSITIQNKFRFNIEEPIGDDLGLQAIVANSDQELREEFNCS